MKINHFIVTGPVKAGPSGLVLLKDTFTGPLTIDVVPGKALKPEQVDRLKQGGQLMLTGRLAMLKKTTHQYPKGTVEAVLELAKKGDLAGAEAARKKLKLGIGESFTVALAVDDLQETGTEVENRVELVAEVFEFGADLPRFGYKVNRSGNDYRNARKFNIKQAVQPRHDDDPSQVMRFRGYCNRDKVNETLTASKGRFHVEGRLLGIPYLLRTQPEAVHALIRKDTLAASDYELLGQLFKAKADRVDGAALDITKATQLLGKETFYFDLSEINLPLSVKTDRGFEAVSL